MTSAQRGNLGSVERDFSPGTNATKKDTDDGYWDGWIGVHGVGRTDNVVLYMEHLRDEDMGIQSDEIVQEQVGTHMAGGEERANVQLGELHWREFDASQAGDPNDPAVTPDPTLEIEVDHYAGADKAALAVLDDVERNYALYGLNVTFTVDQELTDDDLDHVFVPPRGRRRGPPMDLRPPTSYEDAVNLEERFHNDTSKLYLFISNDGDRNSELLIPDWAPDVEGVASSQGIDGVLFGEPNGLGFGILVFTDDHNASITGNTEGPLRTHLQKTTVHEVGHIIGAGRADDGTDLLVLPDEVYSGDGDDDTIEPVGFGGPNGDEWSVMSGGWNDPIDDQPMNGRYIAFSIEELSTVEFNRIDSRDD